MSQLKLDPKFLKRLLHVGELFDWELWRTGMLRLDIGEESPVLHIWDHRYQDINVTMAHDHPFDLESSVIAGTLTNLKFTPVAKGVKPCEEYWQVKIQCGTEACMVTNPVRIYLQLQELKTYRTGDIYRQQANEIHETVVDKDGAITFVNRTFGEDRDNAHVYIPNGMEWGDAKPRPATVDEIREITQKALKLF